MRIMSQEFAMIPHAPEPLFARAAPSPTPTEATTLYFNARLNRPSTASLQRDSGPIPALEQMFGYYEA